jgi:hypothetical protein
LPRDYNKYRDIQTISDTRHDVDSDWTGEIISKSVANDKTSNANANSQTIESYFKNATLAGDIIWETSHTFKIDRSTKEVTERDGEVTQGTYYLFPRKITEKNYSIWSIGNNNLYDFVFEGVDEVLGLNVSHFSVENFVVDDTIGFEWLDLVPEKYEVKSVQSIDTWVEPTSGIVVLMEDRGTSYYVDPTSGERIYAMQTWDNKFSDDTIAKQVRLAQNEKQRIQLFERWIPILLGLIAFSFLIALFASRKVALRK